MRRVLTIALVVLWSARGVAQQPQPQTTGPVSLSTTTCPGPGCVTLPVYGYGAAGIQVTGTFSGTLTFQGSFDQPSVATPTFNPVNCLPLNSTTPVTTTTGVGGWTCGVAGLSQFQVVFSAYASGTAVVTITTAFSSASKGAGGGGAAAAGTLTGTTLAANVVNSSLTSTGTLTNLTVTNPIAGSVTGSSGSTTGAAPAGSLTGTTLAANVVNSSLTSLGLPVTISAPAIATTSTNGGILSNPTAATAGVPVQQSPNLRFLDNVWNTTTPANNTDSWIINSVPVSGATPSGILQFGSSLNGGATTFPFTFGSSGYLHTLGPIYPSTVSFGFGSWSMVSSTSDGSLYISSSSSAHQVQINEGTASPTVATCGTGAVTTHSTNTAGEVTPTGATACSVVFGAPNFANKPFCTITVEASTVTAYLSAVAATGFTVSGLLISEPFMWTCFGGI